MKWSPEILQLVYEHILSDRDGDLKAQTAMLRVCRTWHDIAVPLLWTDIVLTSWNLKVFLRPADQPNLRYTRSLTIYVQSHQISLAHMSLDERYKRFWTHESRVTGIYGEFRLQELHTNLLRMTRFLSHMLHLECFSFRVSDEIRDGDELLRFWLSRGVLRQLLTSLPASVQQLEIDTVGYESNSDSQTTPVDAGACLCRDIATIGTRLKHLRVRLGQVCPRIFAPSSTLQSLTINFTNHLRQHSILCNLPIIRSMIDSDSLSKYAWWSTRSTTIQMATNARHQIVSSNKPYPNLKSFHIIEPRLDVYSLEQRSLVDHDILASATTTMPFWQRYVPSKTTNFWALQTNPSTSSTPKQEQQQHPSYLCTTFTDLVQAAEGPGAWTTTTSAPGKPRFPTAFKTSFRGRSMSWSPNEWITHDDLVRENPEVVWYDDNYTTQSKTKEELEREAERRRAHVRPLGEVVEFIKEESLAEYGRQVGYVPYEWD